MSAAWPFVGWFLAGACGVAVFFAWLMDKQREELAKDRQRVGEEGQLADLAHRVLAGEKLWLLPISDQGVGRHAIVGRRIPLTPDRAIRLLKCLED